MEKRCCTCKKMKDFANEFSRDKSTKDGRDARCKMCHRQAGKNDRKNLSVARRERKKAWSAANRERLRISERKSYRKTRAANPNMHRERCRSYRCARLGRTPAWADKEAIKRFYAACPEGLVVDHIVPLQGKNVSGLHVHYNLQYLTPLQNFRKNNHYPYEIKNPGQLNDRGSKADSEEVPQEPKFY